MVEVCNISKNYGKYQALKDVSFSLDKGTITAFLGPNGAGKSTTMGIIVGALSATEGRVLFEGEDITTRPEKIKRNIGFLPEYNSLYEDMYVREYLEYVASIYLPYSEIICRVETMIEAVNIESEYRKKIGALSNGNKRRVGLAQALIHDPNVLVLDEPSNGLDPIQHNKMKELIIELGKSKVVLYSSHRFDDISDIASRYLILNKGTLMFDGEATDTSSISELFYTYCK